MVTRVYKFRHDHSHCLVAFELIHISSSSFFLLHYHYSVGSSIAMLKGGKLLRNYSIKFRIFSRTLKLSSTYRFSGSNFRNNCSPLFHDVKFWVHDLRCCSDEKGKHLMLSHRNCRFRLKFSDQKPRSRLIDCNSFRISK